MIDMTLVGLLLAVAFGSFLVAPRVQTPEGFFSGQDDFGRAPSLWTLVFSQVTTWIFARSLLNAAILGYYYGIAGTLAYGAYYFSFFTGMIYVDRLRFVYGFDNIQSFLKDRFGHFGSISYNIVVVIRLLSEVFANLLVVGILFGVDGSTPYTVAVILVAFITLAYSMMGGLRAALRTDVLQASLVIVAIGVLFAFKFLDLTSSDYLLVASSSPDFSSPGWVLLVVALLQVISYPAHDPVMMDRGFLADRATTRASFIHAGWISFLLIMVFGLLGVCAGLEKLDGEDLTLTLQRLLDPHLMTVMNFALVISAVSTLDSTFSSASKLVVKDMGLLPQTPFYGRLAMVGFFIGGLGFLFLGSQDLFAAVAVSGTAAMFLTPVFFYSILGHRDIAIWSYVVAFVSALIAATLYMTESSGYTNLIAPLFGVEHKYSKLLVLCVLTVVIGMLSFQISAKRRSAVLSQDVL